jgi:hypothetical protein
LLLPNRDRTDLFFLRPEATGKHYGLLYQSVLTTGTPPRELASTSAAADYPRLLTNGKAAFVSWSAGRDGYHLLPVEEKRLRDFMRGSAATLTGDHANSRFLLVLWSVDCAPCLREFEQFAALRRQGRRLLLVLVATDGLAERERVTKVLARFGLQDAENWIFADENAAKLRFEIDPGWHGEMPIYRPAILSSGPCSVQGHARFRV